MKDFDYYRTKLPYYRHLDKMPCPVLRLAYDEDVARLREEFAVDLKDDLGITDNPKAEALINIAWEKGHAYGYEAVYNEACDLVELIR